jgi:hypothetical protein
MPSAITAKQHYMKGALSVSGSWAAAFATAPARRNKETELSGAALVPPSPPGRTGGRSAIAQIPYCAA